MAADAAEEIRYKLGVHSPWTTLVLGHGWDVFPDKDILARVDLSRVSHFNRLRDSVRYKKDRRTIDLVQVGGRKVVVLRRPIRIHEAPSPLDLMLVRLQFEMLYKLGVRRTILTDMGTNLSPDIQGGTILVVDSILHHLASRDVRTGSEFKPRQHDKELRDRAMQINTQLHLATGPYATSTSPAFDFAEVNRAFVANTGALALGLGLLDGANVAAISLPRRKVLALSLIVGERDKRLSHKENLERAAGLRPQIRDYLSRLILSLD